MKPLWIIIDGVDGAGKTTLCKSLQTALNLRNNTKVIHLPYKHCIYYEDIRELLTHNDNSNPDLIQYYMVANYRDALQNFIIPTLNTGTNVILDRWITSTIVYNIYDQGNFMRELCNLSWLMSYNTTDGFMNPKIMNIDIIHKILTIGIDMQGYIPDALIYLIPNQTILDDICKKRKDEGSKEVNDVDHEKLIKINKIFSNMALMSTTSIPFKNLQGMVLMNDIKFDYTDIKKVVAITGEESKVLDYYTTLFPDSMQVIHEILEHQLCAENVSAPKNEMESSEIYQNTEYLDSCATFGNCLSGNPSFYYEQ